jgi:very-short-patch-repair endonuclease
MGQSNFRDGGRAASASPSGLATARAGAAWQAQPLPIEAAANFILDTPNGVVVALGGIDGESLRGFLDQVEPHQGGRVTLFVRIAPLSTAEAIVEQIVDLLAVTARCLWPIWFTDVSFDGCRNDTLGRFAIGAIARGVAQKIGGLSPSWIEAAARLVLNDRPPRVIGTPLEVEFSNLSYVISRAGLVLVADIAAATQTAFNPAAAVRALEWIAHAGRGSVIALFRELPPSEPPFDRILFGSRLVIAEAAAFPTDTLDSSDDGLKPWIAPWRGSPHPLSEIEKRLAQAIGGDIELASLFAFNQLIETVRGTRPKVDLVWSEGRLVVELDGYGSHGNRAAFMYDRHRDYELTLSGYTVLRLSNDEIAQDYGKAIEKIRDLVRLRRMRISKEA